MYIPIHPLYNRDKNECTQHTNTNVQFFKINKHISLESSYQMKEYVQGQRKVENKANNPTVEKFAYLFDPVGIFEIESLSISL